MLKMDRVAQSVWRLATGWMVRGSNPGGGAIFRTCPDRPWGPPNLLYNGYRVFPGVKSGRGVTLNPHALPVPRARKSRAIPLLPLWAVRPVQSLSACTRVHFTFTFLLKMQALCDLAPRQLLNTSWTSVMERHEEGRSTILRKVCECLLTDVPHMSEEFNFKRERWGKKNSCDVRQNVKVVFYILQSRQTPNWRFHTTKQSKSLRSGLIVQP